MSKYLLPLAEALTIRTNRILSAVNDHMSDPSDKDNVAEFYNYGEDISSLLTDVLNFMEMVKKEEAS